jgi:hypothetical protein
VIENRTSAGSSIKGAPSQFVVLDQTEEWTQSNGGIDLADTIRDNVAKVGGSSIESPNAFIPGDGSVAEQSAAFAQSIAEGTALNDGLLYDHREAPPETDMYERESSPSACGRLRRRVRPPGRLRDPRAAVPARARRPRVADQPDLGPGLRPAEGSRELPQPDHPRGDSWIDQPWAGTRSTTAGPVAGARSPTGDVITLGFDGSRGRRRASPTRPR